MPDTYISDAPDFPTDVQIHQLSEKIGIEIEEVAARLGLNNAEVQQIKHNHPANSRHQNFQILLKWRKRNQQSADERSEILQTCFRACGREDLVKLVDGFYKEYKAGSSHQPDTFVDNIEYVGKAEDEMSTNIKAAAGSSHQATPPPPHTLVDDIIVSELNKTAEDVENEMSKNIKAAENFSEDEFKKNRNDDEKQILVKTCVAKACFGGETNFGKSSLVRSLLTQKSFLMVDERTEVVDLRLWTISPDTTVPVYDIGGHPCYQQIAHLFYSDAANNMNVIVHDITRCEPEDYKTTYQWITDVIMRSPKSCLELVLTKSDLVISEHERNDKLKEFKENMKKYLEHDKEMADKIPEGPKKTTIVKKYEKLASNIDKHLYTVSCINEKDIERFHKAIVSKINKFQVKIPESVFKLYKYLGKLGRDKQTSQHPDFSLPHTQPRNLQQIAEEAAETDDKKKEKVQYITFKDAEEFMRDNIESTGTDITEELKNSLKCLHQNGLLLWFEHSDDLNKLIFNDIGSFVYLLRELFHHEIDQVFPYGALNERQISKETYDTYVNKLKNEGLLSIQLLEGFAKRFAFKELAKGLKYILCDLNIAIKTDDCEYIYFPWYVQSKPITEDRITDVQSTDPDSHCLHLRLSGSIPSAFFNYFTVSMFNYLDQAKTSHKREVWKDGFFATKNKTKIYFKQDKSIDIYIKSPAEKTSVDESWKVAKHCNKTINDLIKKWWPGMMERLSLIYDDCDCRDGHRWTFEEDIIHIECKTDFWCPCSSNKYFPSVVIHPLPKDDKKIKEIEACLEQLKTYNERKVVPPSLSKELKEWMRTLLTPDTPLYRVSIPGTHDSMTYESWLLDTYVMCQEHSLSDQLNAGIRFLDIRLKKSDSKVIFSHGPIELNVVKYHFTSVISKFLTDHPKEFLIMRIKDEKESAKDLGEILFNESENNFFKELHKLIWKKELSASTTVGDVQGKIVLVREYKETAISSKEYNYGCKFKGEFTEIADMWNLTIPLYRPDLWIRSWFTEHPLYQEKFELIKQNFEQTDSQKKKKLCISFLSGTNTSGPKKVAECMNDKMLKYLDGRQLANQKLNFCGIIVMDFPSPSLIQQIINVNKSN